MIKLAFDSIRRLAGRMMARVNVGSERGATAVEYSLMVVLIAAVIVAVVVTLGHSVSNEFSSISGQMP